MLANGHNSDTGEAPDSQTKDGEPDPNDPSHSEAEKPEKPGKPCPRCAMPGMQWFGRFSRWEVTLAERALGLLEQTMFTVITTLDLCFLRTERPPVFLPLVDVQFVAMTLPDDEFVALPLPEW